ncbi:MAG: TrkH family potassium uptake protein [Aquificaceae bacterium]|nr:TrkH family potassium uptake protein [Aquificaceae bacterium]MDW8236924.1 TrkH family potassium uptake protein [Aquificaceae bacterium]
MRRISLLYRLFELTPYRILLLSHIAIIILGSFLLYMPFSTTKRISYLDALFTATSATTVTGLTTLDTEKDFTFFGKLVILILIQLGGLGYMTITTYFLVVLRKKLSLRDRLILAESFNYPGIYGLVRFLKRIIPIVFLIELLGTLALFPSFLFHIGKLDEALFSSLFHSVSAFNNAGFSTFSSNLINFRASIWVNLVISFLIILGGIGFYVIYELLLYIRGEVKRLSTHTKLALTSSTMLIFAGFFLLIIDLWSFKDLSLKEKFIASLFHSISARTAGFNTLDISKLSEASQFVLVNLMFIGASPGGTGGGIKTITATVVFLTVFSYLKGKHEVTAFGRRLIDAQVHRAMVILSLAFAYCTFVSMALAEIEGIRLLPALFETVSAFATVGLSIGNPQGLSLSADFSPFGKGLIVLTMIVGRVGVLSFMLALLGKERRSSVKLPEARLLI